MPPQRHAPRRRKPQLQLDVMQRKPLLRGTNMKPTTLVVAFALTLVSAYTLYAQQSSQPDLSGTWTLNLQKSKLPKKTRPTTETLVITSSGTTITARYTIDSRQSSETYVPDGKEKVVREFQGGKLFSRAKWRGPVLITETYGRIFNG